MTHNSVQSMVSTRTAMTSEDPQCVGTAFNNELSIESGYTATDLHKVRKSSINDSVKQRENMQGMTSPEVSRLKSPGESNLHSLVVGAAIDPDSKKELHKVRLQLTQRQQRIQALISLFDTLLSKLKELDMLPGISSIEIDQQFRMEGADEGVQRITEMFFGSTGVNPQPLLSIIQNIGGKIQTIFKRLKKQSEKETSIIKEVEVVKQVIRQVTVEVPKQVRIQIIKQVPRYIEVIKETESQASLNEIKAKLQSTLAQRDDLCSKYQKICRSLNDVNQLLRESETNLSRLTQSKNQLQQILDKSEKQKQQLVMYHEYKYELIKKNYGQEKASTQIVTLLQKIHRLERKIRQKELEGEKQKQNDLKEAKQLLEIARKLKQEKNMNGHLKEQQVNRSSKIVNVPS